MNRQTTRGRRIETMEVMRSRIKTLLKRYPEEDNYKRNSKSEINITGMM